MVGELLTGFDRALTNFKRKVIALRQHTWLSTGTALVIVNVLGTIAGGTLTAVGGYLATLLMQRLDNKRAEDQADRDYRAAVRVGSGRDPCEPCRRR